MAAVPGVFARLVDDDRRQAVAHLAAERGGHVELVAGAETEIDAVEHRARRPGARRDARDGHIAQPSGFRQHAQDGRNGLDSIDRGDIAGDGV
jgi:hypothetical protein